MIFVKINSSKEVEFVHNMPFDEVYGLGKTEYELLQEGVLVDSIPDPEQIRGKEAVLKLNENRELYYEYIDRPLTEEEEIDQLKQKNAMLETSLLEMTVLAAEQEQRNIQNEQAIMELTTIIAGGNA